MFVVRVPAWLYLGGWFFLQLRQAHDAIVDPSAGGSGVALFAHIGGFVFGWIIARALIDTERRRTESPARRSALTPS